MTAMLTPDEIVARALTPDTAPDDDAVASEAPWEITDRGAAEWAISKIRSAHQAYHDEVAPTLTAIDALRDEITRLEQFIGDRRARRDNTVTYFESRLTAWLRDLQRDNPATKSVQLSGGAVKSTAGRVRVVIDDPQAFVARHGDDSPFVKVERTPVLRAVMDHVKASEGEIPDGVTLERADTTYRVVLDGAS